MPEPRGETPAGQSVRQAVVTALRTPPAASADDKPVSEAKDDESTP